MVCVCLWAVIRGWAWVKCICVNHADTHRLWSLPLNYTYQKRGGELRKKNGKRVKRREDLNYKNGTSLGASEENQISPISFLRLFKITVTYISHVIPLTRLLMLSWCVFTQKKQRYQPIWPTFITLIHNMTLLHHLSTQRFSSPEALVTAVTDGNFVCVCVCFYAHALAHMCV